MARQENLPDESPIDRNHPDALYAQLRNLLRGMIERRELAVNDKLPSERELVAVYGVSRITVRQAIKELENLGYLQTRPGKGIYVTEPAPVYELEVVRSFTQTAHANNRKPGMRLLRAEIARADPEVARPLSLPTGAEVVFLERLRLLDGVPVVVQRDWFSASLTPGILDIDWTVENRSLYDEFENRYGILPSRGQSTLSARLASDLEASLLQLDRPAAVLTLDQIAYDSHNRTVNISAAAYHPTRYPLSLTQSHRRF
ncbi:UTRA domain-containing protein [Sinorhizobium medicae]|uniref:GntR family transcriptional regulator n=1 Tax=Sinorhizobium medicae TaxID=110321 RepID=UPI0004781041|nr:GntR family transcriptional regulator [Sinorhizobium medicae]MDX0439924.1 UTRA domain-containing protein [Sinorhizobium medicae]MDX0490359.1 UTRA domain-containing protein [Sinorhizobium medicae]MDX0494729.1 UTRA domain-containing protein [Sinorhizobium medicae]MDX0539299.1 UTRA domain-containing protein [Sinorhizobium medicae]MDX0871741.1 UTRA domain-containing protein [Sinorhizobium medicae]